MNVDMNVQGATRSNLSVLDRLVILLDTESALIEAGETEGLADTTLAKSRMLLEINRLATGQIEPGADTSSQNVPTSAELSELKQSLDRNERALSAQLAAARTLSDLVTDTLRDQLSDTTYANRPVPKRQFFGSARAYR